MDCLKCMFVCCVCDWSPLEVRGGHQIPVEQELLAAMNHCVGAGN